nr:hypothetical protein [Schwartzia sp. (in: firmicutes)]
MLHRPKLFHRFMHDFAVFQLPEATDFVNDRYGVATNNISPDDVASVEIMENHQPVKVLEGLEFSQQAGLNIKLKEAARAR